MIAPRPILQTAHLFIDANVTLKITNAHLRRVRATCLAFIFGVVLLDAIIVCIARVTYKIVTLPVSGYARSFSHEVASRLQTLLARRVDYVVKHRFDEGVQV